MLVVIKTLLSWTLPASSKAGKHTSLSPNVTTNKRFVFVRLNNVSARPVIKMLASDLRFLVPLLFIDESFYPVLTCLLNLMHAAGLDEQLE